MKSLMSALNEKIKRNPDLTHLIAFNGQTVTAFEHSDQTVIKLVKRYYEGHYGHVCKVLRRDGVMIHGLPVSFGPLASIGSPSVECKNTTGVYLDGHVVGAIYWIVTSTEQGYSLVMQSKDLGLFTSETDAKNAAIAYARLNFSSFEVE